MTLRMVMCIDALFLFLRQIHCNSAHKYHASGKKQNREGTLRVLPTKPGMLLP